MIRLTLSEENSRRTQLVRALYKSVVMPSFSYLVVEGESRRLMRESFEEVLGPEYTVSIDRDLEPFYHLFITVKWSNGEYRFEHMDDMFLGQKVG